MALIYALTHHSCSTYENVFVNGIIFVIYLYFFQIVGITLKLYESRIIDTDLYGMFGKQQHFRVKKICTVIFNFYSNFLDKKYCKFL